MRDETSASVARLRATRAADADFELVETSGGTLATCVRTDVDLEGRVDDQWSLRNRARLPLPGWRPWPSCWRPRCCSGGRPPRPAATADLLWW